jgi:hypothetical protein
LWHIDPLLGKDLETYNESTAVAMHGMANTPLQLQIYTGNDAAQLVARQLQQRDYNNGNGGVFYVVNAEEFSRRKLG